MGMSKIELRRLAERRLEYAFTDRDWQHVWGLYFEDRDDKDSFGTDTEDLEDFIAYLRPFADCPSMRGEHSAGSRGQYRKPLECRRRIVKHVLGCTYRVDDLKGLVRVGRLDWRTIVADWNTACQRKERRRKPETLKREYYRARGEFIAPLILQAMAALLGSDEKPEHPLTRHFVTFRESDQYIRSRGPQWQVMVAEALVSLQVIAEKEEGQ